jgi:hypothetical protein
MKVVSREVTSLSVPNYHLYRPNNLRDGHSAELLMESYKYMMVTTV